MVDSPLGLCAAACHSLGDLGGALFTLLAFAWGAYQAWMRSRANREADKARSEKDAAVTQLALSLRPTIHFTPSLQTLEGVRPFGVPPVPKDDTGREPG